MEHDPGRREDFMVSPGRRSTFSLVGFAGVSVTQPPLHKSASLPSKLNSLPFLRHQLSLGSELSSFLMFSALNIYCALNVY